MRRKARRYLYGAYLKGTGTRLRGLISVAEIPFSCVSNEKGEVVATVVVRLADHATMQLQYHERASNGAEKPFRSRRRKRGLRKGRTRNRLRSRPSPEKGNVDRECVTLADPCPLRPSIPKSQRARHVNHVGRKFIWAMRTSSGFRKKCQKYVKARDQIPDQVAERWRDALRMQWLRYHTVALRSGIPPQASFSTSFRKYLAVETTSGRTMDGWASILAGLPGNPEASIPIYKPRFPRWGELNNSTFYSPKPKEPKSTTVGRRRRCWRRCLECERRVPGPLHCGYLVGTWDRPLRRR